MALPRKGDPRRPLHLAIRSTRMLAILFLAFGLCVMVPWLLVGGFRAGRAPMSIMALGAMLVYFGPGVAYLVFSIYLGRRRSWAIVASIVLASVQLIFTVIATISILAFIPPTASVTAALIPLAALGFIVLALAQLIYHLALSFTSIKYAPVEQQRGFEPIPMAVPVNPSPPPADQNQYPPAKS